MGGAYIAWVLSVGYFEFNYPVTFIILIPVLFFLGVLFERTIIRPLRWRDNWKMTTMMVTLGTAFVIDNFNLIVFGPGNKLLPPVFEGSVAVAELVFSYQSVVLAGVDVAGHAL